MKRLGLFCNHIHKFNVRYKNINNNKHTKEAFFIRNFLLGVTGLNDWITMK